MAVKYIQTVVLLLIASGCVYQLISLYCVVRFGKRNGETLETNPDIPVSVLKPVSGMDPDFLENIDSFCRQDYPEYEVLLGFTDEYDSAIAAALEIADV
jgi:ceramide glucosyltransferase